MLTEAFQALVLLVDAMETAFQIYLVDLEATIDDEDVDLEVKADHLVGLTGDHLGLGGEEHHQDQLSLML